MVIKEMEKNKPGREIGKANFRWSLGMFLKSPHVPPESSQGLRDTELDGSEQIKGRNWLMNWVMVAAVLRIDPRTARVAAGTETSQATAIIQ